MGKPLDAILAEPPLKRIQPGAKEAMASVAELAAKPSTAPQAAVNFAPAPETPEHFSFSFSLNPMERIFDFSSARPLFGEVSKTSGVFKGTIHF